MQSLAPCAGCARHVVTDALRCPFCGAESLGLVPLGFDPDSAPPRVRYAALALGASLALSACPPQGTIYGGPPVPVEQRPDAAPPPPPPTPAPAYGLPPPPPPAPERGGEGNVAPLYGLPPR